MDESDGTEKAWPRSSTVARIDEQSHRCSIARDGFVVMQSEACMQHPSRPSCILVLDPSEVVRKIIETHFQRVGHVVASFADPLEAIQAVFLARTTPFPDLLFLEWDLPRISCVDVMKRFHNFSPMLPIVVLSPRDGVMDVVKARLGGATDYLMKPFQMRDLTRLAYAYLS